MTYALIKNGIVTEYPVYEGDIKLRFPNTSFPIPFVPPPEYEVVVDVTPPEVDYTKVIAEGTPEYANGVLTRVWIVSDASPEVVAELTEDKSNQIRSDRNQRLAACDWTQLPDAPVDHTVWASYRQELRDISIQEGFPWDVLWPEQP